MQNQVAQSFLNKTICES